MLGTWDSVTEHVMEVDKKKKNLLFTIQLYIAELNS